jgi:hypothetical protein
MAKYKRELQPLPCATLSALTARQLLGLRNRLLRLEDSAKSSDRHAAEMDPRLIQFKSDPRWSEAYDAVRAELSKREHLPKGPERITRRKAQAQPGSHGRKDRREPHIRRGSR